MDGLLRRRVKEGRRAALAAFGLPSQPGLGSVGIKAPTSAPGFPPAGKTPGGPGVPNALQPPSAPTGSAGVASPGVQAAKFAFNVGMGASTTHDGAGAQAGEPADEGRRQRSIIDRALQRNDDDYATSSMPMPGAVVSP
jgi:hypothetical protein